MGFFWCSQRTDVKYHLNNEKFILFSDSQICMPFIDLICLTLFKNLKQNLNTVNPLYNDHVCSKLSLTLTCICCYKEMPTSTWFPHHKNLIKRK